MPNVICLVLSSAVFNSMLFVQEGVWIGLPGQHVPQHSAHNNDQGVALLSTSQTLAPPHAGKVITLTTDTYHTTILLVVYTVALNINASSSLNIICIH